MKKYKLFELYSVKNGIGNKKRSDFHPKKYPFKIIMFKDVFYNSKLPVKLQNTIDINLNELNRFDVKKGDVFLTNSSETKNELAMSSVAYFDYPNTVYAGFLKRLRPKTRKTYYKYMRYWFRSKYFRNGINSSVSMTTRANLNNKILEDIEVLLPSIEVQIKISSILDSISDKIELNNKINNNLEDLAQTLYKHWFVDFEFPNEEGLPYKSSGGKMVESELGMIPKGWQVREQKKYFPVITGKKNANIAKENGKYKFFTCSKKVLKAPDYSFEAAAILVAGNGDFNVKYYNGKFEAYQRTYVLIPYNSNLSGVIYFMMKYNLKNITSGHRGSVIKYITKGDLENFKVPTPNEEEFEKLGIIFQDIVEMIQKNNKENEKLAELRDLLLPKLMSGEIRVPIEEE